MRIVPSSSEEGVFSSGFTFSTRAKFPESKFEKKVKGPIFSSITSKRLLRQAEESDYKYLFFIFFNALLMDAIFPPFWTRVALPGCLATMFTRAQSPTTRRVVTRSCKAFSIKNNQGLWALFARLEKEVRFSYYFSKTACANVLWLNHTKTTALAKWVRYLGWEVFWILRSVYGFWEVFWIPESVLSLWATV